MQYKKIIAILSLTMLCTGSIVGCNNKTANTNTEVNKHIQASDEWCRRSFGNGNLRSGRPDWCVYRMAQ